MLMRHILSSLNAPDEQNKGGRGPDVEPEQASLMC